jgi:hypothetical protein
MSGTVPCKNGQFNSADCTAKDSQCAGNQGEPCRGSSPKCNSGLFCCNRAGVNASEVWCTPQELNTCQPKRTGGRFCGCDDWCTSGNYCSTESDQCDPNFPPGVGDCAPGEQ